MSDSVIRVQHFDNSIITSECVLAQNDTVKQRLEQCSDI